MLENTEELNVYLEIWCNETCKYCFNNWLKKYYSDIKEITDALKKWIEVWIKNVMFIWKEALFYPNILLILISAKKMWYQKISIKSNWLRFWDMTFLEQIKNLVNKIEIIYNPIDKIKKNDVYDADSILGLLGQSLLNLNSLTTSKKIGISYFMVDTELDIYLKTIEFFQENKIELIDLIFISDKKNPLSIANALNIYTSCNDRFWDKIKFTFSCL